MPIPICTSPPLRAEEKTGWMDPRQVLPRKRGVKEERIRYNSGVGLGEPACRKRRDGLGSLAE